MVQFRSALSSSSTAAVEEGFPEDLERWKRKEGFVFLLRCETNVFVTALPWSIRMMIRLNAMPCEQRILVRRCRILWMPRGGDVQ